MTFETRAATLPVVSATLVIRLCSASTFAFSFFRRRSCVLARAAALAALVPFLGVAFDAARAAPASRARRAAILTCALRDAARAALVRAALRTTLAARLRRQSVLLAAGFALRTALSGCARLREAAAFAAARACRTRRAAFACARGWTAATARCAAARLCRRAAGQSRARAAFERADAATALRASARASVCAARASRARAALLRAAAAVQTFARAAASRAFRAALRARAFLGRTASALSALRASAFVLTTGRAAFVRRVCATSAARARSVGPARTFRAALLGRAACTTTAATTCAATATATTSAPARARCAAAAAGHSGRAPDGRPSVSFNAAVAVRVVAFIVATVAATRRCGVAPFGGVQPTVICDGHAVAFGIGRVAATAAARLGIIRAAADAYAARQVISVFTVSTVRLFSHRFAPCSHVKGCDPAREVLP